MVKASIQVEISSPCHLGLRDDGDKTMWPLNRSCGFGLSAVECVRQKFPQINVLSRSNLGHQLDWDG